METTKNMKNQKNQKNYLNVSLLQEWLCENAFEAYSFLDTSPSTVWRVNRAELVDTEGYFLFASLDDRRNLELYSHRSVVLIFSKLLKRINKHFGVEFVFDYMSETKNYGYGGNVFDATSVCYSFLISSGRSSNV
jgi:hypothetical protein